MHVQYHFPIFIVSPKLHYLLGYGWTSFVVEDLRADSLIVLLTLSELKIASIQKIFPCPALEVRVNSINYVHVHGGDLLAPNFNWHNYF